MYISVLLNGLGGVGMKITKVNHVRSGIAGENFSPSGMLYTSPSTFMNAKKNNSEIEQYVQSTNKRAQGLYRIFNMRPVYAKDKKLCSLESNIIKLLGKIILNVIKANNLNTMDADEIRAFMHKSWIENDVRIKEQFVLVQEDDNDFLPNIIGQRLRKSLSRRLSTIKIDKRGKQKIRRIATAELLVRLVRYLADPQKADKVSNEWLKLLFNLIEEDYWKNRQSKNIACSITANNVKVQVDHSGEEPFLVLFSYLGENHQKRTVFQFIREFALASEEEQEDKIKHIKKLLFTFICGEEESPSAEESIIPDAENIINQLSNITDKLERKQLLNELKDKYEDFLRDRYRKTVETVGNMESDRFWIKFFQDRAEKLLFKDLGSPVNIGKAFLCKTLYREWRSYLAMKFIDLGKGVFHFAMPDLYNISDGAEFGKIQDAFINGISSFDYERIKAEENLSRSMAVAVTYAAAIFANSAVNDDYLRQAKKEDVLLYNKKDFNEPNCLKPAARRNILQFFGGHSKCNDINTIDTIDLTNAIKSAIKLIRNHSYHYVPRLGELEDSANTADIIRRLFSIENNRLGRFLAEKYHSTGTSEFYSQDDIEKMINYLYSKRIEHPAQIPAFSNVLSRKKANECELVTGILEDLLHQQGVTPNILSNYVHTLYFLMKEIYYHDFIGNNNLKDLFFAMLREEEEMCSEKEQYALKDFSRYMEKIKHLYFSEICQLIMTEVNLQNQGQKSVRSSSQKERDRSAKKEIYQHYRMLLWKILRKAFLKHLQEDYQFLLKPNKQEAVQIDEFCPQIKVGLFSDVETIFKDEKKAYALAWYVIAHFMPPKQLNEFKGDLKNYVQFIGDINKRAKIAGHNIANDIHSKKDLCEDILLVLDVVSVYSGQVSGEITDYFDSVEDYNAYRAKFYENLPDDENVQLNRGIVLSTMYGVDRILASQEVGYCIKKQELEEFKRLENTNETVFNSGSCSNIKDQLRLNKYQQMKNRLELHDISIYTSMVIDYMAQLVTYAYFRERDLLYYQLGVNYLWLNYGDVNDRKWNVLIDDKRKKKININIAKGALLYNIVAMYTADLPVIGYEEEEPSQLKECAKNSSVGAGITSFVKKYCHDGEVTYNRGLSLFDKYLGKKRKMNTQDKELEDVAVILRNSIDHMKYLSGDGNSILDYYSDIYNCFFEYDIKQKKSVGFIIKNILMKYFVIGKLNFVKENNLGLIKMDNNQLKSDEFQYQFGIKKGKLPARSDNFVKIAGNILSARVKVGEKK